jgi:hypothetical protein
VPQTIIRHRTLISLFRQQRNAYLTGFTLLLLLVLYRMQSLLHDFFTAEAKSGVVVSQASNQSKVCRVPADFGVTFANRSTGDFAMNWS